MIEPFLKGGTWSDPMFARMKILMTNTSTPYHRGDMMNALGHGYAMHDKRIYQPTQDARKTIFSYP